MWAERGRVGREGGGGRGGGGGSRGATTGAIPSLTASINSFAISALPSREEVTRLLSPFTRFTMRTCSVELFTFRSARTTSVWP